MDIQGAQVERGELFRRVLFRAGEQGEEAGPEQKVVEEARKDRAGCRVVGLHAVTYQDRGQEFLLRHPGPCKEIETEAQAEILQDMVRKQPRLPFPRRTFGSLQPGQQPPDLVPDCSLGTVKESGDLRQHCGQQGAEKRVQRRASFEESAHAQNRGLAAAAEKA